ncbi:C45 family autoproteolytic acyltransferase/hydolase [Inconstantimicrobium mannanitabidum]|uniref:Choloylglycine hydrolase n=1 Tax=Inconstantimicrobium mannanitabidum TaxID=1604901 RepID=A0ACB5RBM7_9CLOT|nr:C45 family peptidase [Clostridium sp. TW13]GKX66648.1 choloylglycine hydrolase [Clostridium sp. TW13]
MKDNVKEVVYKHLVVSGTSYEIGKMEGEFLKKYHQEQINMFVSGNDWAKPVSKVKVNKAMEAFNKYCPYINEEIAGLAESLGVTAESIIHYAFSYVSKGNCSHFAVLPSKTLDEHLYVGRSYEWSTDDELRLMTTRGDGLNAHIGFSLLLLGRLDGINEHGLCVTMSNAIPCEQSEEEGLRFWMVIRILLDKCKTVEEAIALIIELPISSYCNLIISDKSNKVVLAEICNSTKVFKNIDENTEDAYVCSTNHYTLDGMESCIKNRMRQSVDRYNTIVRNLDIKNNISKEEIKGILSKHMPEGVACHYYDYGLGTLWSMIYDVTMNKVEMCFGSPVVNKWYTLDLNSSDGMTEYNVILPLEKAEETMWEKI